MNHEYLHEAFAKHNYVFSVGDKVKTRGDIGSFPCVITKIHISSFCEVRAYGKLRHMNMAFLVPRKNPFYVVRIATILISLVLDSAITNGQVLVTIIH